MILENEKWRFLHKCFYLQSVLVHWMSFERINRSQCGMHMGAQYLLKSSVYIYCLYFVVIQILLILQPISLLPTCYTYHDGHTKPKFKFLVCRILKLYLEGFLKRCIQLIKFINIKNRSAAKLFTTLYRITKNIFPYYIISFCSMQNIQFIFNFTPSTYGCQSVNVQSQCWKKLNMKMNLVEYFVCPNGAHVEIY